MALSMTGYGRAQKQIAGKDVLVEIKSVNHRFFEFSCRAPRSCAFLEDRIKKRVQERTSRGKTDLNLSLHSLTADSLEVKLNEDAATAYAGAMRRLCEIAGLPAVYSPEALTRFPEIFIVERKEEDEEALWQSVCEVLDEALDSFVAMRRDEGANLKADILSRVSSVEAGVAFVEEAAPRLLEDYRQRLFLRISDLLSDRSVDEGRLLTEAAIFAERIDVGEETVRIRSHIEQYRAILNEQGAVGRKLDFLTQELNREVNTIGSKIQDIAVSGVVVAMKSDIEKIREQIQNLE